MGLTNLRDGTSHRRNAAIDSIRCLSAMNGSLLRTADRRSEDPIDVEQGIQMDDFDARRAAMELVTAFVNNHQLTASELPTLLTDVFNAIAGFDTTKDAHSKAATPEPETTLAPVPVSEEVTQSTPPESAAAPAPASSPAVSIAESIRDPDFILSLITGEKLKTLKRHLRSHGLTEAEYRERYNLPNGYPFVAPSYSQLRRKVASNMGLGRKSSPELETAATSESVAPTVPDAMAAAPEKPKRPAPKSAKQNHIDAKPRKARKSASPEAKPVNEAVAKGPSKRAKTPRPVEADSQEAAGVPKDSASENLVEAAPTQTMVPETAKHGPKMGVSAGKKASSARKPKVPATADKKATVPGDAPALVAVGKTGNSKRAAASKDATSTDSATESVETSTSKPSSEERANRPRRSKLSPIFS